MAFTQKQADMLHNRGLMPDWAWMQQNGKTLQENLDYYHKKAYNEYQRKEKEKQRKEAMKQIQQMILDAIIFTMNEGSTQVAENAASDIVGMIQAALGGSSHQAPKKSLSADLGAILGRALGEAPFKLLEEIFKEDEK